MQLDHPLDGIAAKLERADESIEKLDAEINQFLTSTTDPCRIEGGFYGDSAKYEFRAYAAERIPLRFSVLAGEIVHQFRSCLDHLVVALAVVNGQRPLNTHQFPICRKRDKFKKAYGGGQVKGISRKALRRIIKAQPYRHPIPDDATINVIHQLDVRDKHSLLLVVAQSAQICQQINVGTREAKGATPAIIGLGEPGPVIVTEKGVEVFSILLESPVSDFYAEAKFTTQIAFANVGKGKNVPVIPLLTKMAAFTRKTISESEGEF
jgi:hypothetical protein